MYIYEILPKTKIAHFYMTELIEQKKMIEKKYCKKII